MNHYLLIGAGFSRNWGGWLANEAFEYLLGVTTLDEFTRNILWQNKLQGGGFEAALAVLQATYANGGLLEHLRRLDAMNNALVAMFTEMQATFSAQNLTGGSLRLQKFLSYFDAIFTLNQDTFLETHYAGDVRWSEHWQGSYLPKMKLVDESEQRYPFMLRSPMTPDPQADSFENLQPIYKLHGSFNWQSSSESQRLLVMGGNKTATIQSQPVLAEYQRIFDCTISRPNNRLMIIGYSFGDDHINNVIQRAAIAGTKIFIIDPTGVDVFDKRNPAAQISQPATELMRAMMKAVNGASRRPLSEIIYGEQGDHAKVMKFFDGREHIMR
ncbi:SIR2 family protein [Tardiphaga sp.]|jgi:hypothetical protein|uniref:SIR2 family protein n=1 Tax=Tardiphaga sp. TaxID=1926292 RepID=UPI0037D9C826